MRENSNMGLERGTRRIAVEVFGEFPPTNTEAPPSLALDAISNSVGVITIGLPVLRGPKTRNCRKCVSFPL
jgi:hypothetical protein